jgi:Zn-finger nucleic acid-binding protein
MWEYLVKKVRNPKPIIHHQIPESVPKIAGEDQVSALRKDDEHAQGRTRDRHYTEKHTPGRILQCPKCHIEMDILYIRDIAIDECPQCGGVFLDAGELTKLIGENSDTYQKAEDQSEESDLSLYSPDGMR